MTTDALQRHPSYERRQADWQLMEDAYEGERTVKSRGATYLKPTPAMVKEGWPTKGTDGALLYEAYQLRAVFPDHVTSAVDTLSGLMHRKPAVIETPERMKPWLESLTSQGEDAQLLLRKINVAQLKTGRYGLLVEVPDGATAGQTQPFVVVYDGLSIINWNTITGPDGKEKLNLLVLNESGYVLNENATWEYKEAYRVLALTETDGVPAVAKVPAGTYVSGVTDSPQDRLWDGDPVAPQVAGTTLDYIPFTFVNAMDLAPDADKPPLLGLGNLCMTIYRGEADYRQSLFLQGQETLVIAGGDEDQKVRVGAHAVLHIPMQAKAEYVGVSADGLEEQRTALENDNKAAAQAGSRLLSFEDEGRATSGESLKVRISAKTPTLQGIAETGGAALQMVLGQIAEWTGGGAGEVVVEPNQDFVQDQFEARQLVELQNAKVAGAPISSETIHDTMRQHDMTDKTYEEELAAIEAEAPLVPGGTGEPEGSPSDA